MKISKKFIKIISGSVATIGLGITAILLVKNKRL